MPDGERVLVTRDTSIPKEWPEHVVVIGWGTPASSSCTCWQRVRLQGDVDGFPPAGATPKDPEVAAVLEEDFLRRGVRLLKGARAVGIEVGQAGVVVECDDGRRAEGSHALLAIGSIPNTQGIGLESAGVEMDGDWPRHLDHHLRTNVGHIYMAGDISGKLPLASVA